MSERKAQIMGLYSSQSTGAPRQQAPAPHSTGEQSPGGLEVGILHRAPNLLRGYGKNMRTLKSSAGKAKDAVTSSASAVTSALNTLIQIDRARNEVQEAITALDTQVKAIDEQYAYSWKLLEQIAAVRIQAAQTGQEAPPWADYNTIYMQPGMAQASSAARQVVAQQPSVPAPNTPSPQAPAAGVAPGASTGAVAGAAAPVPNPNAAAQEEGYKRMVQMQMQQQMQMQRAPLVFQKTQFEQRLKNLQAKYQQAQQSYDQANGEFSQALGQLNNHSSQLNQLASELQEYQETTLAAWSDALSGVYGIKGGDEL